jgi:hypothetical protein
MERDAPRTAWIKMIQLRKKPAHPCAKGEGGEDAPFTKMEEVEERDGEGEG